MPTLTVKVRGVVQGVGFRYFVRRTARDLGLAGQATNLPDGSVHVTAEGSRDDLEALLAALRRGPVGSRVEHVEHAFDRDHDTEAGEGFDVG